MNMTLKEELKSYWPKIKLHGGRLAIGMIVLAGIAMGGWVGAFILSYILGMLFVKAK